jgi:hypothetical protein
MTPLGTNSIQPFIIAPQQFTTVNLSSTGVAVGGVPGYNIFVISLQIVVSANLTVQWESSTGPTNVSGPQAFAQNGGIVLPANPYGWFRTAAEGDSLNLAITGVGQVGGSVTYCLIS